MNVASPSFNVLSLCSGGGGLDLGVRLAVPDARTVCYVENEVTACGVLVSHMEDGGLDDAPLWTDLRTFDGAAWRGTVDCITGGYPCQPFSNAGRRLGEADPRHLWPHVAEIVRAVEPRWCFFENVGAHLRLGFHEVARDLQGMGYRVAAVLLTAEEVGAPHGRERLFILAQLADAERRGGSAEPRLEHQERAEVTTGAGRADDGRAVADASNGDWWGGVGPTQAGVGSDGLGRRGLTGGSSGVEHATSIRRSEGRPEHAVRYAGDAAAPSASCSVGDADLARLEGRREPVFSRGDELPAWPPSPEDSDAWGRVLAIRPDLAPAVEPEVRGVADGLARGLGRSDQLHVLGNGVVPQQAAHAWSLLMDALLSALPLTQQERTQA